MQYKYYIADVFTNTPFSGAQIAVFPNADGLDKSNMQLLARELNLSETAFAFSPTNGSGKRRMRIFTPHAEIDFSGHPIIAVGHVLASIGEIKLEQKHTPLKLEQNIGVFDVNITQKDGQPELIQFAMETKPMIDRFVPKEEQIAEVLSLIEEDIDNKKFNPLLAYSDQPYLIVPVKTYSAVRAAKFNFTAWSRSMAPACMANEILLFSTQTDVRESNFHARLLGPNIGIHEDPPIASAMPAFSAYLCAHDHIKQGTHTFVIDRGSMDKRKSVLNIEMDNKLEETLTIRVGGPAIITGEGGLLIPDAGPRST
jgi:trans-2,3-dihydro-3-hydroxyanthranilate isomerase